MHPNAAAIITALPHAHIRWTISGIYSIKKRPSRANHINDFCRVDHKMRTSMVEGVVDAVGRKILIFSTSRCCFYLKCVNVVFQVERLTNFPRL